MPDPTPTDADEPVVMTPIVPTLQQVANAVGFAECAMKQMRDYDELGNDVMDEAMSRLAEAQKILTELATQ